MNTHALIQWASLNESEILIDKSSIDSFIKHDKTKGFVEDEIYSVRYTDGKKYKAKLLVLGRMS